MTENELAKENKNVKSILIVDDEDLFRKALETQLSMRGYRVMDVNNGADAVLIVRDKNPDVVVLELKMPGFDGIQTLSEMKKLRPDVRIIMLTDHGGAETARISRDSDAFRCIQKPCGLDELIAAIEEAGRERAGDGGSPATPAANRTGAIELIKAFFRRLAARAG